MLIDRTRKERLDVPHESGEWVEIRQLTGAELDEASDKVTNKMMAQFGPNLESLMKVSRQAREQEVAASADDRKQLYDADTVLNSAEVGWSYGAPVSPDNIALLDAVTRDWLWAEVVKRNTRPKQSESASN